MNEPVERLPPPPIAGLRLCNGSGKPGLSRAMWVSYDRKPDFEGRGCPVIDIIHIKHRKILLFTIPEVFSSIPLLCPG